MDKERQQTSDGPAEPLLQETHGESSAAFLPITSLPTGGEVATGAGFAMSVVLLSKTIMGAGMSALPLAFVLVGAAIAIPFLLLAGWMTHTSIEMLTLGTMATGHMSYPACMRALCGRAGGLLLELSLVFRCAGLMIVYIIVSGDLLAGGHGMRGLLCDWTGSSSGWCSNRPMVMAVVVLACFAPLVIPRRLSATAVTSSLGIASCCVWAFSTLVVAVVAAAKGRAHPIPVMPDLERLGRSAPEIATQIAAVIPILATAYTCQMTVHHIMRDMKGFSTRRVSQVSASAVALTTCLFLLVALGSTVVFGSDVPADVLQAFDKAALVPLLGDVGAAVVYTAVRLSFLASVITIYPMQMAPYREALGRILSGAELTGAAYHVVTFASLVGAPGAQEKVSYFS